MAIRKIISRSITDGAVVATDVAALSIDSTKLASNAVTNAKIASNAISSDKLDTNIQFAFKNRIINGDMRIDQRNAGASVTNTTAGLYTADRWLIYGTVASKFTAQQISVSTIGFPKALRITSSAAYSVLSADTFFLQHRIEGFNVVDLAWGTASAKAVTVSFVVNSSLTGTFGGSVINSAYTRSYPFTFSIASANTDTTISVTIPGDTSGTWVTDNGIGMRLNFNLGSGATYSGTAGAWAGAEYYSATGTTSVVGTSGATFRVTGVQLEVGSSATPFDTRAYGTELALCQRYYAKMQAANNYSGFGAGMVEVATQASLYFKYPNTMRTAPTFSYSGNIDIYSAATPYRVTSTVAAYTATDQMLWQMAASGGGMTAGRGAVLIASNDNTAFVALSAEL